MTIDDLREQFKKTFEAAQMVGRLLSIVDCENGGRFPDMNIREAWETNHKFIGIFLRNKIHKVVDPRLIAFDRAGEIYYIAESQGIRAAMLFKLSEVY